MKTSFSNDATRVHLLRPASMLVALWVAAGGMSRADIFGSGANTFAIDFVTIGNPGNGNDTGSGGSYSSPFGGVDYTYRMAVYEISQLQIDMARENGLLNIFGGAWPGNQPAAIMPWGQMATFVNWLNTSTGHHPAYDIGNSTNWSQTLWTSAEAWQVGGENLYRHKDAYYFLPSEDEWYKAAYHQNDGATANYWDYPTGSNAIPIPMPGGTDAGTAVYASTTGAPANVDATGALSPYGTRGQGGNVMEWLESAYDGLNDSPTEDRTLRGGAFHLPEFLLRSSERFNQTPASASAIFGFRVASVPEPSAVILMMSGGMVWLLPRRRAQG